MSAQPRPNVVFVFPDQWRGDCLSGLGHPVVDTPFLDDLASRGVTFTSAYSNSPVCIPARACLITGCTPNTVGRLGYREGVPWRYNPTLMTCLRDDGYQTMLAGKTHFFPPRIHLGFEQLALYDNQRHHWPGFRSDYDSWLDRQTNGRIEDTAQQLNSNSQLVRPWTHDEALHANSWTVTAALDMLERRDPTRPFFLQVNFHRPHPPIDPPVEYLSRYEDMELPEVPVGDWSRWHDPETRIDHQAGTRSSRASDRSRRGYFAQLTHLDFQVGRLLRWLQLRGMLDNTIVIFSSDHGEMLGDHHLYRKSCPFEGAMHIPLIVRPVPGMAQGCVRREEPVGLSDIMPTILEMAGVPVPATVEGRSLLPLLHDERAHWRTHLHCEQCQGPIGPWQCVTDGRRKYVWCTVSGEEFFFNLEADPQELHNLATDPHQADEITLWRQRLVDELKQRTEDGFVNGNNLVPGSATPLVRPWVLESPATSQTTG